MPAEPKPAYKLTVKLDGAKPELIAEALTELRERAGEYDQVGESSAQMMIEAHQEGPLTAIMDAFETWLFYHAPGLDCDMKLNRPGLRPETRELLARARKQTPMDVELEKTASPGERAMEWLEQRETRQRGDSGWGAVSSDHEPWEA